MDCKCTVLLNGPITWYSFRFIAVCLNYIGKLAYDILRAEEIAIGGPNKDYARVGMERN